MMKQHDKNMEEKMKNLIMKRLGAHREAALQLNEDMFCDAVCNSFMESLSSKHYVAIMPVDIDDTFSVEQRKSFEKKGFYQVMNDDFFNNMFMACQSVVDKMTSVLTENEDMAVDKCCDPDGHVIYVVSLFGVKNSHFERDFARPTQSSETQMLND